MSSTQMKHDRKVLKSFEYEPQPLNKGYTNKTLYINLSDKNIKGKDVTELMKDKFIGGRGFGLYYLWHATRPETKWNDPENEIVIGSGPIGGITQYPGSGKSLCVSISPTTNLPIDSNVGGYFGPYLKFAGWDSIEIQGKSDKDVIIFIDEIENKITIEEDYLDTKDAHVITEKLTEDYALSEDKKILVAVVCAGSGSDHTLIGCLNFSHWDKRRNGIKIKQAGRGGIGSVFRDKKVKALVVRVKEVRGDRNNPAELEPIIEAAKSIHKEIHDYDDAQCRMRSRGTAHLVEIMDAYHLLPVHNFKFGQHPDTPNIASNVWAEKFTQGLPDGCWYGCTLACAHAIDNFTLKTGPYKGDIVRVDGPEYETVGGVGSCCGIFDAHYVAELNFYCDTYGVDTISFGTICAFAMECYENGIINKEITGGLELNFGNKEAAMELLHQMGAGKGFGKIAGLGIRKMKELFAKEYGADPKFLKDIGMEVKGLEYSQYVSKESLAQQGGYAIANKGPQHDEAWLIFMDMVKKQIPTFEDKAEALFYFPLFRTWFGLNGLCKLPWNDIEPADNLQTDEPAKVPKHVQNYCDIFSAVTGKKIDKQELIAQSRRVYNFQKIFNLRRGSGLRNDDRPPYRSIGPVTDEEYLSREQYYDERLTEDAGVNPVGKKTAEKVKLLREYRESQYEKLLDAVYKRRGWTKEGIPKPEMLKEIGMDLPELMEIVNKHL
ncbi:MAG: aldehyde ferredoxin oxidoreductase C-terminal domain-containing protein [Cyanobacteriota bacterium]